MSTDVYSFDMKGDTHLDAMLTVAYGPQFGKPMEFAGYKEVDGTLRFYKAYAKDYIAFPAPLTDLKEVILSWLRNQEWSESGQYEDVMYRRGFRIFNTENSYELGYVFSVAPYWTEYHK